MDHLSHLPPSEDSPTGYSFWGDTPFVLFRPINWRPYALAATTIALLLTNCA